LHRPRAAPPPPYTPVFSASAFATGPVYFGYGLAHAGLAPTVVLSATVMFLTGYVCAKVLRRARPV